MDYTSVLEPETVEELVDDLLKDISPGPHNAGYATELHKYVSEEIDYPDNVDSGYTRKPSYTLEQGGNCADQTVLLCSMFENASVDYKIVRVRSKDGGNHVLPVASFPNRELVHDFIESEASRCIPTVLHGCDCYPVDPVHSEEIGDSTHLRLNGYSLLTEPGDKDWNPTPWRFFDIVDVQVP